MITDNLKNSYYLGNAETKPKCFDGTTGTLGSGGADSFFLTNCGDDAYSYNKYVFKPATATGSGDATKKGYYVLVGTDNTSETKQDYNITEATALTHKFGAIYKNPEKNVALQVESVYENATNDDVVIKEMCLIAFVSYNSYTTTTWQKRAYMIGRKVLSSPVTIHSGEIYKFVYKIDM